MPVPLSLRASVLALAVAASGCVGALAAAAPASADEQPASSDSTALHWAPPALDDPTTVVVPPDGKVKLKHALDYLLVMTEVTGTLHIIGGHNVVLVGGVIDASGTRAMYFQNQTGTLHVEGVKVVGDDVHEGIDIAENDGPSTVQLEDVDLGTVHGSYSTHHADLLQTWSGPTTLNVDRLEGSTTYQGVFDLPRQHGTKTGAIVHTFRHVVTRDVDGKSKYHYWFTGTSGFTLNTTDVIAVKPGTPSLKATVHNGGTGIQLLGSAPSPLVGDPGAGYDSPGYAPSAVAASSDDGAGDGPAGGGPAGDHEPVVTTTATGLEPGELEGCASGDPAPQAPAPDASDPQPAGSTAVEDDTDYTAASQADEACATGPQGP